MDALKAPLGCETSVLPKPICLNAAPMEIKMIAHDAITISFTNSSAKPLTSTYPPTRAIGIPISTVIATSCMSRFGPSNELMEWVDGGVAKRSNQLT